MAEDAVRRTCVTCGKSGTAYQAERTCAWRNDADNGDCSMWEPRIGASMELSWDDVVRPAPEPDPMDEQVPGIYYGIETDNGAYDGYDVAGLFDTPMDASEVWGVISALHYGIRAGRKTADPTRDLEKMRDVLGWVLDHRAARMERL